jgi:hypothetical protein
MPKSSITHVHTLLSVQSLSDSNFPEAALFPLSTAQNRPGATGGPGWAKNPMTCLPSPLVTLEIAKQAGPGDTVFFQERGDRDTAKVLIPQGAYLARRELVPASRRLFLDYSSTVIRRSLRAGRAGGLMRHCICYVLVRNCSRGIGQGREVLDDTPSFMKASPPPTPLAQQSLVALYFLSQRPPARCHWW